jgi:hypothetical protein
MTTIIVLILIAVGIFLARFFIYFFKVNTFFGEVADEYMSLNMKGIGRQLSNRMIILRKLTGNASYSITPNATAIIDLFDIADTMQFLLFFNGSIQTKLDTIPKMAPDDVARNDRSMILRTGFNQTQRSFVTGQPHLRSNTIDLMEEFHALAPLLIRDCQLFHRIPQSMTAIPEVPQTLRYKEYQVRLKTFNYQVGNRIGLQMVNQKDGSLITTVTTNVPDVPIGPGEACVKSYSENEGMFEWLVSNRLVTDTGRRVDSGYVRMPIVKVSPSVLHSA